MQNKHKEHLQRQIDLSKNLVPAYTKRFAVPSAQFYSKMNDEQLINLFQNHNFDQVLDLGCGSGFTINSLSVISKEVYGIDLSIDMLHMVENNNETLKGLLRGDAENLPFKENSFSHIFIQGMLHHLENYKNSLSEAYRILSPGGEILVIEPSNDVLLIRVARRIMYKFSEEFDEKDEGYKQDELVEAFRNAGFEVAIVKRAGYLGYLFAQFPDKFSFLSNLPFSIGITRILIFLDRIFAIIPLLKSISFQVVILGRK